MAKTTSQKTKTSTSSSALQKLQNANNEAKKKLQTKAKTQKAAVSNLKKANAEAKNKLQAIAEEESKSKKNKLSALDKVNAKINELEGKEVISTKYKIGELKPSQKLREKTQQNKELLTKINTAIDKLKSGDYNKTTSAFEDYVNNSGYGNQFSKADIMLGSKDPYAGAGLLAAKQRYNNATSQAEKDAAHTQAEAIRNYFLYSGGTEGGEFKPVSTDSMTLKSKTNQLKFANQEPAKTEAQQMKEKSDKVNSDLMAFGEDSLKTTKELEEELKAINQRLAILGTKNGNVSSIRGAAGSTINADAERAQLIAQKQSINNHIELLKQQEGYNTYFQYEKNRNNPDFESTVKKFNATDDDKKKGIVTSYLNMMTSDEREMFKYLYVKNGADSAYKYVEFITSDFNAEKRMNQLVQNYQREGAENPVKASVSSILSSPLKGISYVGQAADYLADGKMKDNAWYNTFTNYSTALRDGVSTTVEKNFGTKGSFLYQVGMSLGDFLVAAGLNPSAAVGILGTAAAADMTVSAKKRGLSDNQAIALGTLAGVAETIFEKVSLDALIKPNLGKEVVSKFLLKNIAIEGSEEAATEIANTFSDIIVSRDQSLWSQDVQSYIDKGYSRKEAEKQAFYDQLKGVGLAALGGALAGGVLSGGRVSLNKLSDVVAKTNNTIQTNYQNKLDREYQNKIKNDETAAQSLEKDNKTKNQTVLPKYGETVEAKVDNTVNAQGEAKAQEETKEAPAVRQEENKQTELVDGRYDDTKDTIPELSKTDKMTARDLIGKVYRTKSLQQASELFDNLKEKAETEGDLQTAVAINTINNQLKEGKAVDPEKVIALADNINNAEKNAIIDMFSQTAPVQAAANTTAGNLNQEPVQTTETQTEDNNKFNFNTSVTELNRQLDAGEITQDEYDEAYDYLIQEEDIEGGSMLFPDTKLSLSDNVKEKLQSMTPAEKEAVVKRISDAIGVNIESYRQKYGANGMYYGGQIRANTASDKSIEFIISHELTHLIENSGHYNTIKDVAMAAMGTGFFDEVSRVKKLYNGKYNRNLTDEQIEQEVVADFVGNELLTNERQITELAKNNRTVAERILAWLDRTVARLTGDEAAVFRSMYDGARRIYAKALSEAKDEVGKIEFGDVDKVFAGFIGKRNTKFSLSEPVEYTEKFIAWHNMNEEALKDSLELGGLVMPSFAIIENTYSHDKFGDFSVLASSQVIDPSLNNKSMIFSGDAYTPSFGGYYVKINKGRLSSLIKKIEKYLPEGKTRSQFIVGNKDILDLDDYYRSDSFNLSKGALFDFGLKNLYLKEKGINVKFDNFDDFVLRVNEKIDDIDDYLSWVNNIRNELIENKSVYNPAASSAEELYLDYTLLNAVKVMENRTKYKDTYDIIPAAVMNFKSINDAKEYSSMMKYRDYEVQFAEFENQLDYLRNLIDPIDDIYSSDYSKDGIIVQTFVNVKNEEEIDNYLKANYSNKIVVNDEIISEMKELMELAQNIPQEYLEAKIYDALPLNSWAVVVAPDNADTSLIRTIKDNGIDVIVYRAHDEVDRIDAVNEYADSHPEKNVRFSISDTKQNADSNNSEKYVPNYAKKVDNGYEVTIKTLSGKTRTETIKGRTYNSGTDWTERDWDLWKRTIESEWTDKTTANERIEADQYIYAPYQKGVANENNFMWSTLALFEPVSYRPKRKPDYVSYGRNGKVSSEYWYTKDGVIRGSNHWGENIATCDWGLKGKNGSDLMKTNKLYGFAPWNEFVQKSRKINTYTGHNLGFTDFENTIGKGKVRINGKNYEYDKYDGLWDDYDSDVRFSISEEGNVYDRFPKKAQDYVRRIMNGVKTSAINSFDIKPGHKNEAKDILDELRDEYLNNGCVMREGRKLEYIDRILVNSKLSEEAKAVMTVEFGNALDDGLSLLNQAIKYSAEYYGKRGAETGAETGAEQEQGEEASYFDQVIQSYLDDYGFRDVGSDASTNINPNAGEIAVERVVAQNRQKALDRDRIINMNLSELGDKYTELKKAKRKIDRISQKNLLTDDDRAILDGLMRGEVAEEYIDAAKYNKKAIVELFKAKQEREAIVKEIKLWNWARRKAIRDEVQEILDVATIKKEKKAGYLYARETMERNTEDVFDKETAKRINDFIFKPVHKSVKASMDYKKQMRERVTALNISQKIASGNEMSEAYVVQALGEAQANIRIMNRSRGTITWRQGKTLEEWTEMVSEIYAANPNMDFEKIQNCINEFQKIYDELFQNMNESRLRNGYEPVNYLQGYFPHFSENEEGLLGKFAKAVGIKLDVNALPTAINGMTHVFRPGIRWFANANERLGFNTAYDCIQGFDSYIEGCSDVIHLTDAIQRLRAFSTQIRWNSSDEGMKRQMKQIQDRQDISEEEKEDMIRKLFEEGKYELSGYVANLDEYTNLLANKKSKYDRNMEALFNRKFYSLAQKFESRVAANMIVPNVGSWLTNFIPITQAWAQVGSHNLLHGMLSTVGNVTKPDGLKEASVFLSTRDGSRPIVRTKAEKAADVVGRPMMWIDEFTCGAIFRGRYYQELRRGMSEAEAMDVADDFTRRVISGRTKGSMPILFEARNPIFKMMTQFQLEVNNEFSYLFKDIPREGKEKGLAYIGMMIFKFCLGAWLYDELYYWLIGRKPALDPIDIVNNTVGDITGYHIPSIEDIINGIKDGDGINFATERKENPLDIVKGTAEKILDRIPIVGSIGKSMMGLESGGRYPVFNALPTWSDFETYLDKDVSKEKKLDTLYKYGLKLGAYTAFPFGGGEVKKVIETIRGGLEGGSYSVNKEGKKQLQYPMFVGDNLKDNILEGARSVLFGKTTLPTAREWINNDFNTYSPQLTEAYKFMIDNGEKRKSAFSALKQVNELDVSGMTSTEKAQALSQLISGFDIGKTSKMVLYAGKVANEDESTAIFNLIDSGVDENVLADVVNEIFSAYSEGLTGNEKKAAIRSAIDSAGLNEDQTFELYKGFINTGYDDYVEQFMEAGITQSQAESAAKAIVMLKPRSGSDTVSYIDKYLAILGSGKYSATQQFELLQGQSYWDGYEYKVQAAYDVAGVTPEMFAKMQAQKFELGVGSSGSMNKGQLKKAVDAVGNEMSLTTSQKAALWQTYSLASGFKSKNNPYSTSVGAEVEAAMRSGNTTKITNKDVENFNGTKNFSLEDMRCTDGSLEVTKGLVNQANKIQQLRDELGTELTVNSWYRSPSYNSTVEGAARNSFHTKGMATDIKIPSGANAKQWVANASAIWHELNGGAGGVIYYAKKGFVHFDSRDTRFDGVS